MTSGLWKTAVVTIGVALTVELMALAAGHHLARRGLLYAPGSVAGYEEYLARRDPLLGWPAPSAIGDGEYDSSGSRLVPLFPDPGTHPPCVSVFGDSFTWGDEVAPERSYPNLLSGLLGCRVANYGVPAYGTDQAYLRFKHRIRDAAKIVVLGHWSEDILRNINQFRGFIAPRAHALKPRFRVDGEGRLVLVPAPVLSPEELADVDRRPELLSYEYFRPGGPSGVVALRFPYSVSLLRLGWHFRVRARLRREPSWAPFYAAAHPSGALRVTAEILEAFDRDARQRGQAPVVLLIPDQADLRQLREGGVLAYAPLADELSRAGIETPDVAGRMLRELGERDACALFTRCPSGHLNPQGNALLARIVRDWIEERGLPLP
jgi:hypothetical protein